MAKILVVDDRSINLEFLKTLLGYRDHRVIQASDGAEALELIKAERPDLVISDILMPTMDGYELVRQMRADPASGDIPVIFNTAHYLDREARALADACGVSQIMYKPGEPELVLRTVDAVLNYSPAPVPGVVSEQFDREHLRVVTDKLSQKTEDLRRVNQRLGALIELGHQMAAERDPLYLLECFCHSARKIVGAKYAALAVLDEDKKTLLHFFTSGMTPEVAAGIGSPPVGRGLIGLLLREGGVVRTGEISKHARSEGFPPNHPPMTSFLGAAISSSTGLYGSLYLADKIGVDEFSQDDERLISMLAAQVGVAYENATRFEELRRRASELQETVFQRKRDEEALREANQALQSIVQTSPLAIIALDLDGSVRTWNAAAERIFGWSEPEVTGRANPIIPEDKVEEYYNSLEITRMGGMFTDFETVRLSKDGTRINVTLSAAPRVDGMGNIQGSVVVIADSTERKHLEEEFRQAQKMEAVGRLAGGVAHDFNNLLTAIIGYSQLALARVGPAEPMRKEIEEIEKAGQRAASLTGQLLAFSRRQVIQPQVLDVNAVVADLTNMLRRLIGEDIELEEKLDPEIWNIKADRGQIEQIMMNLAVNSRDAMPEGGKLTIQTANFDLQQPGGVEHVEARPGRYVMLAISDTGAGMDKETQSRIFEPFFTTKDQGKGTGLGLSTVYGIVKQNNGFIDLQTEPARGTVFKIYLPRIEEAAEHAEQQASQREPAGGSETILLVEDESAVRKLARTILEAQGYKVLEAASGDETSDLCQQHKAPIDLLLTDVVMPGNSGRELAQRVMSVRPEIKVVYMSGYTDDSILHHGVLNVDTPFLHKPFTRDSLLRKIREVLDAPLRESGSGTEDFQVADR